MSPTVLLLATVAGLLVLAFWWLRPILQAVAAEVSATPTRTRDVTPGLADPDCGIGIALMASAANGPGAGGGGAAPAKPKRKKPVGPDRREFLRKAWLASFGGVGAAFGLSVLGFMWPRLGGGFGAEINLGSVDSVLASIADGGGRLEYPAGRLYMVAYDSGQDDDGVYAELNGDAPVMAIYQKCVHLGCRVPWCDTSKWFECPCHGSRYNRWGEYQFGPAPRGLDRFPTTVRDGQVFVNTAVVETGPSRTTQALGEPAAGPNCN